MNTLTLACAYAFEFSDPRSRASESESWLVHFAEEEKLRGEEDVGADVHISDFGTDGARRIAADLSSPTNYVSCVYGFRIRDGIWGHREKLSKLFFSGISDFFKVLGLGVQNSPRVKRLQFYRRSLILWRTSENLDCSHTPESCPVLRCGTRKHSRVIRCLAGPDRFGHLQNSVDNSVHQ